MKPKLIYVQLPQGYTPSPLSPEKIIAKVEKVTGISFPAMRSKRRKPEIVLARQIAMASICHYTRLKLAEIGDRFGGRDHSTVIHAREAVHNYIETGDPLREVINKVAPDLVRHIDETTAGSRIQRLRKNAA